MKSYFGVAKDVGISEEEIGAVQAIVMAVQAGQIRAKFREARSRPDETPSGSPPSS